MADQEQDFTITELLQNALRSNNIDLHVSLPGKIVNYDSNTQKADIKPLIKKKYTTEIEKVVDVPIINEVPVFFPQANGGKAFLHMPINTDDTGLIVFCDRSIDNWLSTNDRTKSFEPDDSRIHDLSDAVFFPGINPFTESFDVSDNNNVILKNGSSEFQLTKDGKFKLLGNEELVTILIELFDLLINDATVVTILGASPFTADTIAKLTLLKAKFESIKI
jgi:hypothetical protein